MKNLQYFMPRCSVNLSKSTKKNEETIVRKRLPHFLFGTDYTDFTVFLFRDIRVIRA